MVHRPKWFKDGEVFVSFAPTVGINKDGQELYVVDPLSGKRTFEIDDQLLKDVRALLADSSTDTSRWVAADALTDRVIAVPVYFDDRPIKLLDELMVSPSLEGYGAMTLADLVQRGWIEIRHGHGSPSADLRQGDIPYIKVSDIRAGQININPTNRVSDVVAKGFWRGDESGLKPYDLITPIRSSKNIGEFAVLMPGQEKIVLTKEVLVIRASKSAPFDTFYILWAMTLKAVRKQWDRIVFMQTNREDVGKRYEEIVIPVPPSVEEATAVSQPFRSYYEGAHKLREQLMDYLVTDDKHYVFMSAGNVDVEIDIDSV